MKGYIYKTTYLPTGEMYFGSRKLPEGLTPETDSYRGSPKKGTNRMAELFATRPDQEFLKEVLFEGKYVEILELENLVIEAAWEKWGIASEGGLVTNLAAWTGIDLTLKNEWNSEEVLRISKSKPEVRERWKARQIWREKQGQKFIPVSALESCLIPKPFLGRKVTNLSTGIIYPSVAVAAKSEGIATCSMTTRIRKGLKGGIWQYV